MYVRVSFCTAMLSLKKNPMILTLMDLQAHIPRRGGLIASISTSHAEGRGFAPQSDHTKDHHKHGTDCPLLDTQALWYEFGNAA